MAAGGKHIAVVIRAGRPARVAEALRAAVGLGLRGDRVTALLAPDALRLASGPHGGDDPSAAGDGPAAAPAATIARAVATLRMLGHAVAPLDSEAAAALREADAVQVWT